MNEYGVAYPSPDRNEERNINNMHIFPQVISCKLKEEAIKVANEMNEYMYGWAVPFENLLGRKEVDWKYITDCEIK